VSIAAVKPVLAAAFEKTFDITFETELLKAS
jgi:hypothetical protein